jgi:hypothetical protein
MYGIAHDTSRHSLWGLLCNNWMMNRLFEMWF